MELERSGWYDMFSGEEIMVAEALATVLPEQPQTSKCFGFPFTWGYKKRRSAIAVPVISWPPHHTHHQTNPSNSTEDSPRRRRPPPPPPPPPKAEASSPATPLSFSPSESDDKDNSTPLPSNISLKREREHYLKIIQDLKKDNELLAGEIKNVKRYYHLVKDFNSKLKARKQELSDGPNQRERAPPPLQIRERESEGGVTQQEARCDQPTTSLGVASSTGSGSGSGNRNNNNMGPSPTGLPDLNLPAEVEAEEVEEEQESKAVVESCCEAMDDNKSVMGRALAAQARQNRIQICRLKNPRYSYSCR